MKYHKHEIRKIPMDLGEEDERKNCVYEIYDENGKYINVALTIPSAKEFIDSNYNQNYL